MGPRTRARARTHGLLAGMHTDTALRFKTPEREKVRPRCAANIYI